jgi:ssDNA-binding replication factor A large subunit
MLLEEILNQLEKQSSTPRKELMEMINKKQRSMSGLVSPEGAAYLVARDLGVMLSDSTRKIEIKNVISGMKKVNIIGRIFRISSLVDFKKQDGSSGKVVNIFIGDLTGYLRVPLWNEQAKLVEDEMIKLGDIIQIFNGMARENTFGDIEVSIGKYGTIRQFEESIDLPSVEQMAKRYFSLVPERTSIKDLVPGNFEIRGVVIDVFKSNFIFNTCSICGGTVEGSRCLEHGEVECNPVLVFSCVVDDGTGDMRVVFFRDLAAKVLGVTAGEMKNLELDERYKLVGEKIIGKEFVLIGKVKKNKMFDRIEMVVNDCKDLNALEESKKLAEEIESRINSPP